MTSLRHKLWLGFGGFLLILLAISILSAVVLTHYSHFLEQVFHDNYNSARYCDAMREALDQLDLRAQQMIWGQKHSSKIDAAKEEKLFADNLNRQKGNVTLYDEGEGDFTNQLAQSWGEFQARYAMLDATPPGQREDFYRNDLFPREREIWQLAERITDLNMNNMESENGRVRPALVEARNVLAVLVAAGSILAAIAVWAGGAAMWHALAALTKSARQIEEGNLDLTLAVRSRDEIGQLAEAFNSMAARLREFRRLDHDRLARTQQTTQLAIDSLPDAVFIIGPSGIIEISNRTAATHFGIEPGLTVAQLSQKLKWLGPLYDAVKGGQAPDEPRGYRSAVQLFESGHERFMLPRAVPMMGPDQRAMGVAVFLVDVTRLRSADEAKSGLVSTVSHELRTPLTSIRMALSLLASERLGPIPAKQMTAVRAAREDSERLYRIVENLMSMSRIESGRAQFQFRAMRPKEIVDQAAEAMRGAFGEKMLSLETSAAADLPLVEADPVAISSALTNLLSNSLKFTPSGGRVTVDATAGDHVVRFSVSDTGSGIPGEFASRVFDKFFRVPRQEGPTGAGLGLAIAKEVIEAHGGTIRLAASSPAGSTFDFDLPCRFAGPGLAVASATSSPTEHLSTEHLSGEV